uniref:Uncharacterized protein n=1 Tax=Rhizophora mucronata TaxID=61149 RepID=A0A2P2NMB7_RHIMU
MHFLKQKSELHFDQKQNQCARCI